VRKKLFADFFALRHLTEFCTCSSRIFWQKKNIKLFFKKQCTELKVLHLFLTLTNLANFSVGIVWFFSSCCFALFQMEVPDPTCVERPECVGPARYNRKQNVLRERLDNVTCKKRWPALISLCHRNVARRICETVPRIREIQVCSNNPAILPTCSQV
jgi:hypothetical protein